MKCYLFIGPGMIAYIVGAVLYFISIAYNFVLETLNEDDEIERIIKQNKKNCKAGTIYTDALKTKGLKYMVLFWLFRCITIPKIMILGIVGPGENGLHSEPSSSEAIDITRPWLYLSALDSSLRSLRYHRLFRYREMFQQASL